MVHGRIQERARTWPGKGIKRKRSSGSFEQLKCIWPKALGHKKLLGRRRLPSRPTYRWRRKYGGLKIDQAKRLKELERENARRKKLLAEAHLDKAMLQEVVSGRLQQCAALNF